MDCFVRRTHSISHNRGVLQKSPTNEQSKMAPKKKPNSDPHGMFSAMIVFLVPKGVQARRLQVQCNLHNPLFYFHIKHSFSSFFTFHLCQIWKERLVQMGAVIEERLSKRVTHVFAMDSNALLRQLDRERLSRFNGVSFM